MKKHFFKSGECVILKGNKKKGWPDQHAVFIDLSAPNIAMVQVEPLDDLDDDDGLRGVPLSRIKPFYHDPSARELRAKAAARMFKMGVRMFRLDKPDGRQFYVEAIDLETDLACGHFFLRKTLKAVPLHSLWPNIVL